MDRRTVLVADVEPFGWPWWIALRKKVAVLEASNVLEAVAVLGRHRIDALIADVDMPAR